MKIQIAMVGAVASGLLILPTAAADASVPTATAGTYTSCASMNSGKYPHGVGKSGATDKTSGKKVTNFTVDTKAYKRYSTSTSHGAYYRDLDRDNDGIACERG